MPSASDTVTPKLPHRFLTLDMMRGFFVAVIIINHLWRWPNAFIVVSGSNQLWFSGAEGFVILSGFLIGYVRGYKGRKASFVAITKKLFQRATLLYVWFVIMTIVLTAIAWNVTFIAPTAWISIEQNDYARLIIDTLMLLNAHNWVHFLWLYAVLIFGSPVLILLLRKHRTLWVLGIIGALHVAGNAYAIEWMKWAPVFYLPLVFGYHLPTIFTWWQRYRHRQKLRIATIMTTVVILAMSALSVFYLYEIPALSAINTYLSKDGPFTAGRLAVAAICFMGLYFMFDRAYPWLNKYLGWLLLPFGNWSLAVYTLHGFIIAGLALLVHQSGNIVINTAVTIAALLLARGLLAIKPLQRVLPK